MSVRALRPLQAVQHLRERTGGLHCVNQQHFFLVTQRPQVHAQSFVWQFGRFPQGVVLLSQLADVAFESNDGFLEIVSVWQRSPGRLVFRGCGGCAPTELVSSCRTAVVNAPAAFCEIADALPCQVHHSAAVAFFPA